MKLQKKVFRKDLLPAKEEVATLTSRALGFIDEHRVVFALISGVVVLALVGVFVVKSYMQTREADAALQFGKAYSYFQAKTRPQSGISDTSPTVAYATALKQFEDVIAQYRRTNAGRMAMLYAAHSAFWGQQYDKAISLYQEYLTRLDAADPDREEAWSGLAYSYQAKGDCSKALEYFQKIVDASGYEKAQAYYNMAQCYEKLNENDRAQQTRERIKKEFPDSLVARWIDAKYGKPETPEQQKESERKP